MPLVCTASNKNSGTRLELKRHKDRNLKRKSAGLPYPKVELRDLELNNKAEQVMPSVCLSRSSQPAIQVICNERNVMQIRGLHYLGLKSIETADEKLKSNPISRNRCRVFCLST